MAMHLCIVSENMCWAIIDQNQQLLQSLVHDLEPAPLNQINNKNSILQINNKTFRYPCNLPPPPTHTLAIRVKVITTYISGFVQRICK